MSKLPVECEVYGLFADNIPFEATADGEDLQWGRARQGLIPDLKLCLPSPTGPTDTLAELKFVSAGVTWFPRGAKGKGTDRRAANLSGEYKRKLAVLDKRFHGTSGSQTGPLVQRLQSFGTLQGLVVGPWADGSRDLHSLVKLLGEQRVISQARARGIPASDRQLGVSIGQIRRVLSVNFVKAQSVCLLSRVGYLGPGGKSASERRSLMMRREELCRRERDSHHLAHVKGRGLSRVGHLFT